jgi:hypothetical protein
MAAPVSTPTWNYETVEGMRCRDGSATGIGWRLNPNSNKLLVYLEGGGACFNSQTCALNPSAFAAADFSSWAAVRGNVGIFNQTLTENPFENWNAVYIPYCTGDLHGGNTEEGNVTDDISNQKMLGQQNISLALAKIKAQFGDDLDELFLTGSSAGGYGTVLSANQFLEAFSGVKATVLNDAGPIFVEQQAQPDCLDEQWIQTFQIQFPDDFADFTTGQYTTPLKSMYEYLSNKYPNVYFGLVSSVRDNVLRSYYGYSLYNCAEMEPDPSKRKQVLPTSDFYKGLLHLKEVVFANHSNWKTLYFKGKAHTYNLRLNSLQQEAGGTTYGEWINALRARTATHVQE